MRYASCWVINAQRIEVPWLSSQVKGQNASDKHARAILGCGPLLANRAESAQKGLAGSRDYTRLLLACEGDGPFVDCAGRRACERHSYAVLS